MESIKYALPASLILLAGIYAGIGLYVWYRRQGLFTLPFAWILVSSATWALGYGLEFLAPLLSGKLIATWIKLLGIISVPVFLISFCATSTGRNYLLTLKNQVLLWIIPVCTSVLALTNPYHHLVWERFWIIEIGELSYLGTAAGIWLQFNYAYISVLLILSLVCFILEIVRNPPPQRYLVATFLVGSVLSLAGSFAYIAQISSINLTPFLLLPTLLTILWILLRYRLLDVMPIPPIMVLDKLQDGILVVDTQRRILYLNSYAEKLMEVSLEKVFGQPVDRVHPECADTFLRLIDHKEAYIERTFFVDGEETVFDIRLVPIATPERRKRMAAQGFLFNFQNIQHRKQAEMDLERREAMLGAINMAAQQFLKTAAWEPNIPSFLERLGQVAEVSRTYVFQNYHDQDGLLCTSQTYEWIAPNIKPQINNPLFRGIPIKQIGPADWSNQLSQGKLVNAITKDLPPLEQRALLKRNVRSTLIAPIFVKGKWWGILGLEDHNNERPWSRAELESLQSAVDIFSAAEVRAQNEFALHRRQRTMNLLHEVVLTALQATDIRTMSDSLVKRLSELLSADACFLSSWDEARQQPIPFSAYGQHREDYLALQPEGNEITLTGSVLQLGHTLVIEDLENSPHTSQRIVSMFPFRSVMAFPLISGQKRLGAILLAYHHLRRFQPKDISVGEQAASLIALALEKFQAVEAARRRAEESETLRRASAAVVETLHSNEAINRILEQLSYVLPYDSASVQLLRENELEIVGGRGWDVKSLKSVLGMRFPVPGDNPNTIVIQTGQPYILNDARNHHKPFKRKPHSHIRSWLGVPLTVRGNTIGLLAIDSKEQDHFKGDDIKMAVAFADQVAIALENARLFEEAQNMALTDSLTGLYNRRGLFEIGNLEFSRSRRNNRPFSAVMIDIDHFKRINDLHGHVIGDQALQELAGHFRNITRDFDIVGRYGGEEFAILLSETDLNIAREVAERLRNTVENTPIHTEAGGLRLTISLGVAEYSPSTIQDLSTLIGRADQALYEAKRKGRNRVEISN